ncbi:MAG: UDP-N-acetylmuramoyl-L-alanyl-D-glutamate--2,6-diaminopimelate ligase, partial [Candidatus Wildermuthbacteria bacterium]|nr:UDP-N-acetylmuramoyl-L-alanyl-D-glutamate--2,6-diaminopimelate ligase [Candidatus Wildermuthbacteria bacterium]
SPDHIERHGSFEKYREAKARLFQASRMCHVLNADDQYAQEFLRIPSKKKYLFSKNALEASLFSLVPAEYIQASEYGSSFSVQGCQFHLKLPGVFNVMNALAAICAGLSQGISLETCKKALESIERIPGRMEQVVASPFRVFVDYAFTPAALEKVYETVRPSAKQLICVLGSAGGGRDKWKRPVLGKIAAQFCDTVIVTNEDPYNEDPEKIMEEVMQGAGPKAQKIQDRRQAIRKALLFAKEGDVVMITGKVSEDSIAQKDKKIPWD